VLAVLRALEAAGEVERRDTEELRAGPIADVMVAFQIPRSEWRLALSEYAPYFPRND
jgi:hypothetical protein